MATRSTIVSQVKNLVASNSMISDSDVLAIVQAEHTTLLEDNTWSRRKKETIVNLVAPYSTGSVSTSGTTVTGSGTTFTSAMVGRWMRIGSNQFYHQIVSFTSTLGVELEAALPSDAAAGSAYTIFQHIYALPSNFGRHLNITLDTKLSEWSLADIDRIDPYRSTTAAQPDVFSIRGLDAQTSSGVYQIEFWPVPSAATAIRIEYLMNNELSADASIPLYRSDVLVWKAGESAAFFLHGKTGDAAWLALADRFHARYQETLQGAKEDDLARFSVVQHVRDSVRSGERGDDFYLSRDSINLR